MLNTVDKEIPIPLYYQIEAYIRAQVESGELLPGDKLPTEQWYCSFFGVSRMTVRRALQDLIEAGVIARRRGQGPVVAPPKPNRRLSRVSGLYDALTAQGVLVTTRVLSLERNAAGLQEAECLGIGVGTPVLVLRRIRYADGQAIALQHTYLRGELCSPLRTADLENGSLYRLLEGRGLCIGRAVQTFSVCTSAKSQCRLLELPVHTPLLYMERTAYLEDGLPLEYSLSWYDSSRFSMVVELIR